MAHAKQASLTVLGGPLAGAQISLPEDGVVTIGSAADCTFQLSSPSVSPLHARLVLERGRATVQATGASRPLHVNDNPLSGDSATLRNGDILWLGTPGEEDVVMLQCILPPVPEGAPAPVATPEVETQALWAEEEEEGEVRPLTPETPVATPAPDQDATVEFEVASDEPLIIAFDQDEAAAGHPPASRQEGEAPPTLVAGPEVVEVPDEVPVVEEVIPTVEPLEEAPTLDSTATLPPPPPKAAPPAPPAAPKPPPPAVPPPPAAAPPPGATRPTPAPPGPGASTPPSAGVAPAPRSPAGSPRPAARGRRSSARPPSYRRGPKPPPRPAASAEGGAEPPKGGRAKGSALLAIGSFAGVLIVAGLGWAIWRYVVVKPQAPPTPAPMATIRPTPALRAPATLAPFVPPAETPTPDEPTPAPLPTATPVAAEPEPTPTPAPTATPPPTPAPTPTATPRPPASIAPPSTAAAAPQAQRDAARVQQLLERADAALAAGRHDEAIGLADEALALEPGNSRATETRAQAVARRDLARRRFVTGRTRVQTEKAEGGGGLAGFDTGDADLRRAPDFQGRIEFEMTPSSGLSAGTAWTLRIFVVNEGKKPIQIRDVTATTEVNGSGSGSPVTPRSRQVPTQQRALIGEISGTWSADTTAWSTQVTITANKGDSLRGTLAWR